MGRAIGRFGYVLYGRRLGQRRPVLLPTLHEIPIAQGMLFGRVLREITAVAATPFYANRLGVELASPLVKIAQLLCDTHRRPWIN